MAIHASVSSKPSCLYRLGTPQVCPVKVLVRPEFLMRLGEMLLTVLSLILLWHLAQALSGINPGLGLATRYAPNPAHMENVAEIPEWMRYLLHFAMEPYWADISSRAYWSHLHIDRVIVFVGVAGWLGLCINRWQILMSIKLSLLATLWGAAGYNLAAWSGRGIESGTMAVFWLGLSIFGLISALAIFISSHGQRKVCQEHELKAATVAWVYPGWALFGGLGCLWLTDFAARGYLKVKFYGVYALDWWFLATAFLSLTAVLAPSALALLIRCFNRIDSYRNATGLPLLAGMVFWLVAVLGFFWMLMPQIQAGWKPVQHAASIAELLRLPVWIVMAWIAYRWVESGLRPLAGLSATALLLLVLAVAFWLGRDKGPILVQAVAVVILLAGMLVSLGEGSRWKPLATFAGFVLAVVGLAGLGWMLFQFAPAERMAVLNQPHNGNLEFLSEIRWFIRSVPENGFGLAQVPWCGHAGSLGYASCAGVPQQIQSDYVLAALVGVFGAKNTVALVVLLILWLAGLIVGQAGKRTGAVFDPGAFVAWIIACGAAVYAAQIVVSGLGTMGIIPLTGVSIPMFAYGGASMLTLALLAGLASNRIWP